MTWKESCCRSSVTCKTLEVVEAVVLCVVCAVVAVCCSVPVCCAVTVRCCCGCGSGVVVGARGGAGVVVGSSLLPRVVLGVVAAVGAAATQTVGSLEVDDVVPLAAAVVASAARRYLDEEVGEGSVGLPVAKAQAGEGCSQRPC